MSSTKAAYFYEVDIYRLYKDRAEILSNRFYKTTSPFKGKDCIVKKLSKEISIIKMISEINL